MQMQYNFSPLSFNSDVIDLLNAFKLPTILSAYDRIDSFNINVNQSYTVFKGTVNGCYQELNCPNDRFMHYDMRKLLIINFYKVITNDIVINLVNNESGNIALMYKPCTLTISNGYIEQHKHL